MLAPDHRYQFDEVNDILIADVALRIQLPRGQYQTAVKRYHSIAEHIDRQGSPLQGRVQLAYPQGSMAINATIAARGGTDEYDIDGVVQLLLGPNVPPAVALDALYEAVRGDKGSMYYDLAERQTRCVTVNYADKMHLDLVPAVRLLGRPERESTLFHQQPEDRKDPGYSYVGNSWGFAEHFKDATSGDLAFAEAFAGRSRSFDEARLILESADTDEVPDQEQPHEKSKAVVCLQLLKRYRDRRYADRSGRAIPSVVLAKLIADVGQVDCSLIEALVLCGRYCEEQMSFAHNRGKLISILNPACADDIFTDRWPSNLEDQKTFIGDLVHFNRQLKRLHGESSLLAKQEILSDLFGEQPAVEAIREFNRSLGVEIKSDRATHDSGTAKVHLAAPAIVTRETIRPAKKTFYGGPPCGFGPKSKTS